MRKRLALALLLSSSLAAWAAPKSLLLVGILGDRAAISIEGKRHLLKVGERSPEGLELRSLQSDQATVHFEGRQRTLKLGDRIGGHFTQRERPATHIYRASQGMYLTPGQINGIGVDMMVDTGASAIAMNENTARRLGVDFRLEGQPIGVSTANGHAVGYALNLNEVSVGNVTLDRVNAIVLPGAYPVRVLLGMSFLSRVEMQDKGDRLELRPRY